MHVLLYACMYVCVYVLLYACMYVCVDVCMHACMHVCMRYNCATVTHTMVCVVICVCTHAIVMASEFLTLMQHLLTENMLKITTHTTVAVPRDESDELLACISRSFVPHVNRSCHTYE